MSSHLQVNGTARDHRWRFKIPQWDTLVTGTTSQVAVAEASLYVLYGNDESTGHYIGVLLQGEDNGGGQVITVTFEAPPWGVSEPLTVGVGDEVIIFMPNGALAAPDCDSWELTFNALLIYVNGVEVLIGGNSFLPSAGGPYSDSGTGFDDRLNGPKGSGSAGALDLTYGTVTCSSSSPEYEVESDGQWLVGYQTRAALSSDPWESDPANVYTRALPTMPCDCDQPLPTIDAEDTWTVTGGFRRHDVQTRANEGARTCPSDLIPPGPPVEYDPVYHTERTVLIQATTVLVASENKGIVEHSRSSEIGCDDDGAVGVEDTETETVSQGVTTCASTQSVRTFHGETYCVPSGGLLIMTCPQPTKCSMVGNAYVAWPELPDCEPPAGLIGAAVMQAAEPRYVKATVRPAAPVYGPAGAGIGGDIVVQHAGFSIPPFVYETTVTSSGTASNPCLLEEPRMSAGVILLYEDDGDSYETRSHDMGQTWDTPGMAFAGGRQPKARAGDNGILRAALIYDSGSSGPATLVGTWQSEGDQSQSAQFTFVDEAGLDLSVSDTGYDYCFAPDEAGRWTMAVTIYGETGTSDWFSTDSGRSWTRVV